MLIRRGLRTSIRALSAHGTRSALAVLGVAAGAAAVFLSSAVGAGARGEVLRSLEGLGTNLLVVRPAEARRLVARKAVRGLLTTLEAGDCEAIAGLSLVEDAVPGLSGPMRLKAGDAATMATVLGTTVRFPGVRRFRVRVGRFFDEEEDQAARRVAVLGARVVEALFPDGDPVGSSIRVRGVPFEVVGVFESKGVLADGSDEDKLVVVPLRAAQRRVFNVDRLDTLFVAVRDAGRMGEAQAAIEALLRERHRLDRSGRPDDFAIQDKTRLLDNQRETAEFLSRLTLGLSALAQLVGGTGILALMLLSVRERTTEIGLRMAVGATPRAILAQFLVEAGALSLGGWLLGTAVGALGAWGVAAWTAWPVAVSPLAVTASLAVTVATGVGFGAWPARMASLVPPIQALAGPGNAGRERS